MITQPTPDIELPANVKKQLNDAHNAVTLAHAEYTRLKELTTSEEYTIEQLNKQKVELVETVSMLEKNLRTLNEKTKGIQSALEVAEEDLTISLKSKVVVEALLAKKEAENAEITLALKKEVALVEEIKKAVIVAQTELLVNADKVKEKIRIIEEALQALNK